MEIFPYNLSDKLHTSVTEIQKLRAKILTVPLPLKIETRFKWEKTLQRIYWTLSLETTPPVKRDIAKLISSRIAKPNSLELDVVSFKSAFDYIKQNWYVNPRAVTAKTINTIYNLSIYPASHVRLNKVFIKDTKHLLSYVQGGHDNPIVQAAVVYYHVLTNPNLEVGNFRLAVLSSYLILYKYGLDMRGMLCFEEIMRGDPKTLKSKIEYTSHTGNLTNWIEYFANCINESLLNSYKDVSSGRFKTDLDSKFWKINTRQRQILTLLDIPNQKISNRMVQAEFGVSQITASRDLANLNKLGLIASVGRGRSTFYVKI